MGQGAVYVMVDTLCNVAPPRSDPPPVPDYPGDHPGVAVSPHPLHHPGHQEIQTQI